jgi:hypothetical protein
MRVLVLSLLTLFTFNFFVILGASETLVSEPADWDPMERSLMEIVLRGELLSRNPGAISERAYQSMVDLVSASVLPEMAQDESEELLHFFHLMSGYETARLKYFLPLLKHLLKRTQSEILLAEDEGISIAHFEGASEALRSVIRRIEIRLRAENISQPKKIEGLESRIESKLDQILELQKEILALKGQLSSPTAPGSSLGGLQGFTEFKAKTQELKQQQEETIQLFKRSLSSGLNQ